MKAGLINHIYIFLTVIFTVYGQMIIKWQVGNYGRLPGDLAGAIGFLLRLFFNIWILSGFLAAFLASLSWMAAMTKFEMSYAYPFMSLNFIVVLILSFLILSEPFAWNKITGTLIVISGLIVLSR
jgi:multidrug transporter EmrE-like cation transporter